ncbi:hypothetical protein QP380_30655, partial [Klebsiella aerogenes]|nr:hypothetical protein [Klebsiella aerogenes]
GGLSIIFAIVVLAHIFGEMPGKKLVGGESKKTTERRHLHATRPIVQVKGGSTSEAASIHICMINKIRQ